MPAHEHDPPWRFCPLCGERREADWFEPSAIPRSSAVVLVRRPRPADAPAATGREC